MEPRFRAVIFDMDGVLTDSEPAFYAAVNDVLARFGTHIPFDDYAVNIGQSTLLTWRNVIAATGIPATVEEMAEAFEAPLLARLAEPRGALPHARETVERLRECGVPVGLCTASFGRWLEAILGGAGLNGLFDAVSSADMVERTKPDPAPYRLCASMLGVEPEACIAVEDSVSGVRSALAAGLHVLQLRATATAAAPVPGISGELASLAEFPFHLAGCA
jgi:HAD superfamily hydrolase (TIGR01509 family)